MISLQNFAMFWPKTKLYKGSIVFLDNSLRGQVKMNITCYNISNNDILIEISKQWGAETKDNFDKINDIDFRAIFRYNMYQKYNKSEITWKNLNKN